MTRSTGLPSRSWSGESVTSTVLNHCEMSRDAATPSQAAGTQSAGDVREVRSRSSRNRPRIPAAQTTAASPEGIQDRSRAGLPRIQTRSPPIPETPLTRTFSRVASGPRAYLRKSHVPIRVEKNIRAAGYRRKCARTSASEWYRHVGLGLDEKFELYAKMNVPFGFTCLRSSRVGSSSAAKPAVL